MIQGVTPQSNKHPHFGQNPPAPVSASPSATAQTVPKQVPVDKKSVGFIRAALTQIAKLPTRKFVWGAAGIAGMCVALHGIFKDGMERGISESKGEEGDFYTKLYTDSNSSDHYSSLLEDVRKETRNYQFDHWLFPAVSKVKHVTKEVAGGVLEHLDTLVASAGAIGALFINTVKKAKVDGVIQKTPLKGNRIAQLVIGTTSAGYLLFKGGYTFMHDVLGFGKRKT
jgi:hypothetical protein